MKDCGLEVRPQDDALLLVRIGAGDHGGQWLVAEIGREMRHAGGDVEHLAGPDDGDVLQTIAV